jgi:hypothetical protein
MAIKLAPVWSIDGTPMARNPDSFKYNIDKANVTYEKQADGTQKRIAAPRLQTAMDVTLTWKFAPRRVIRNIIQYCNQIYPSPGPARTIKIDGIQPALVLKAWFDTPQIEMSKENVTSRIGEGGTFQDLTLTLRTDGVGFQSLNFVPTGSSATFQNVASAFGGVIGNTLDYLPIWDGTSYWDRFFASSTSMTIWNLGDQEWNPTIRINGPFSTFGLTETSTNVDGTNQGVQFLWTGASVASGSAIIYDTLQNRCYTLIGSTQTEVYTFAVRTVADGQPFGFWPGLLVGTNSFVASATGSFTAATTIDFSNNGTERFRFWA